jgi:hypothetical protein
VPLLIKNETKYLNKVKVTKSPLIIEDPPYYKILLKITLDRNFVFSPAKMIKDSEKFAGSF